MFSFSLRHVAAAAIVLCSLDAAAQGLPSTTSVAHASAAKGMHFVANAGLSFGGDTIAVVRYDNGSDQKIKAGGLLEFGAGVIYEANDLPVATQLTLNYHVNDSDAKNGTTRFRRYPIEAMLFYTGVEQWRFGIGARSVQSPRYTSRIDSRETQILEFNNTTGAMAEVGYAVSPRTWLNVRYVSEKYKATKYSLGASSVEIGSLPLKPMNGDHILVGLSFQF